MASALSSSSAAAAEAFEKRIRASSEEEVEWCRGESDASTAVPDEQSEEEELQQSALPAKQLNQAALAPGCVSAGDLAALVLLLLAVAVAVLAHLLLPATVSAVLGSLLVSVIAASVLLPGSILPAVVVLLLVPAHICGAATYLAVQTPVF